MCNKDLLSFVMSNDQYVPLHCNCIVLRFYSEYLHDKMLDAVKRIPDP